MGREKRIAILCFHLNFSVLSSPANRLAQQLRLLPVCSSDEKGGKEWIRCMSARWRLEIAERRRTSGEKWDDDGEEEEEEKESEWGREDEKASKRDAGPGDADSRDEQGIPLFSIPLLAKRRERKQNERKKLPFPLFSFPFEFNLEFELKMLFLREKERNTRTRKREKEEWKKRRRRGTRGTRTSSSSSFWLTSVCVCLQGWAHYTGTFLIVADSVMDRAIDIKLLFCNRENM